MNKLEYDILLSLLRKPFFNQRLLAEENGCSLGRVNKALKSLNINGYISGSMAPTHKAVKECSGKSPKNAIVLAAGFGTRMIPINLSTPKALLEVNGERLIERQIKQLHDVGISDITVVVGFMKERFDYLIDDYGVDIVVNPDYVVKNSLSSLELLSDKISNTYIVPSDIWCRENPFNKSEMYSWYLVTDSSDNNSDVRLNRKDELVKINKGADGNSMIGLAYITEEDSTSIINRLTEYAQKQEYDDEYWETVLYDNGKMMIYGRVADQNDCIEINTYEQLRELDSQSSSLRSDALDLVAKVFDVSKKEITDISVLKKGMTNRSFLFSVKDSKYIMRIPGPGTDQLIDRKHEALVYETIKGLSLCDDPVYMNPDNGYKITRFLNGVRVCDINDVNDLKKCMKKLRAFHRLNLKVEHTFDIFGQICFYESLWEGNQSMFQDYLTTKENVFGLKQYVDSIEKDWCLTHIDAVPDNFLFYTDDDGNEALQLTDWEYAGMQDPHVDIAMFCIYSMYNKKQCDELIDIYFENKCSDMVRGKIYCYIAMCGLLWSNWCEYKRLLGVEFGEYSLKQYRFAKDYYKYAKELLKR